MNSIKSLIRNFVRPWIKPVKAFPELPSKPPLSPIDFNLLLHESRSALIRNMPVLGVQTILSAGCSGRWYFDWIERCYGCVEKHIGIEYYSPQPSELPDNVAWVVNTVSEMTGVDDKSCDLVFSGQNIEHLWTEEILGFLLETARVIRPGGHLVIDSPNRNLTSQFNWSHPEHIIELTVEEVEKLVVYAGFDVVKVQGIWLCKDPLTHQLLSLDPNVKDPKWSTTERIINALEHPQHSFIWWLEARRSERLPEQEKLELEIENIFQVAWPERVNRIVAGTGTIVEERPKGEGTETWVVRDVGQAGIVIYGPYMPLRAGKYRVTYTLHGPNELDAEQLVARCDIMTQQSDSPIKMCDVKAAAIQHSHKIQLSFQLSEMTFGMQFRCQSMGNVKLACRKDVKLESC